MCAGNACATGAASCSCQPCEPPAYAVDPSGNCMCASGYDLTVTITQVCSCYSILVLLPPTVTVTCAQVGSAGALSCVPVCPAGQVFTATGGCTPCPAGSFTEIGGATVCTQCPPGTSNASPGSTACAALVCILRTLRACACLPFVSPARVLLPASNVCLLCGLYLL